MKKVILFFICHFIIGLTFAQNVIKRQFIVSFLPPKYNYDKKILNQELSKASSIDEVTGILKKKKFKDGKIMMVVKEKNKQDIVLVVRINSRNINITDYENLIVAQSKNNFTTNLNKPSDFRAILKDTLIILDTLALKISNRFNDYPINGYYFSISIQNNKIIKKPLNFTNNTLYLSNYLINNLQHQVYSIILKNEVSDVELASCYIYFFDEEDLQILKNYLLYLKTELNINDHKELAKSLHSFICINYFSIDYLQVALWLEKQTS